MVRRGRLFVTDLSWGCSFCVVDALWVMKFGCCVVGRRVGVGRVEGLFLVCLITAYPVLAPVEFVVTAAASLLCFPYCWTLDLLSIVVDWQSDSGDHCFAIADRAGS